MREKQILIMSNKLNYTEKYLNFPFCPHLRVICLYCCHVRVLKEPHLALVHVITVPDVHPHTHIELQAVPIANQVIFVHVQSPALATAERVAGTQCHILSGLHLSTNIHTESQIVQRA